MGSGKYTTSHLESLDRYFLLKMCMLHAGSEIFHNAKGDRERGSHVNVTMTSPVEKNCERALSEVSSTNGY